MSPPKKPSAMDSRTLIEQRQAEINRRSALNLMGSAAIFLTLPGCKTAGSRSHTASAVANSSSGPADIYPIDRSIGAQAPRQFSGDDPDRTHRILWDKPGYLASKGGLPKSVQEKVPLVVIGGGISGLTTAYLLRKHKPIVLERAQRFGGNARGESWHGIDYSIGAAYFMEPDPGSDMDKHFQDLNLKDLYRLKTQDDPVVLGKKRFNDFWDGGTDPSNKAQFLKLKQYFNDIFNAKNGLQFPDIPCRDEAMRKYVNKLDNENFHDHLVRIAGAPLHSHIETAIEHYCWSSFGASSKQIGAASGLNFYAGEFGGCLVTAGGNSAVAGRLLERLEAALPATNLRNNSVVVDVRVGAGSSVITYEDHAGNLRSIEAQVVVMACPKFAAARMVDDFEPERIEAIKKIRYHSYFVANVLLNHVVKDDFYDLFLVGNGTVAFNDIPKAVADQGVTDVVLGTFARMDKERSVLTLYRGIPYDGARSMIYADGAYDQFRGEFERQISEFIVPMVGAQASQVADIRITRWGHPLPSADTGLISGGVVDAVRKPFRERMFFIEQDNWMLPAFETGTTEAFIWTPKIEKMLGGQS